MQNELDPTPIEDHDIIRTATGKEYKTDYLSMIPRPKMLFFRVMNSTIPEVATVFANPEETKELWYNDTQLIGFTKFHSVFVEEDGVIKVNLEQE